MKQLLSFVFLMTLVFSCQQTTETSVTETKVEAVLSAAEYHDNTGRKDVLTGGVQMIPITTPKGDFKVWTKRIGNNPKIKVLLLHGGPGMTHEYLESFDSFLPQEGIEYYYYDQLGSYYSDKPKDAELWTIPRFVEEVEQVRKALNLNKDNFYLLGHSWGGILAMEYALKYQDNMKGLIISNMMMSVEEYNNYAHNVLGKKFPAGVLDKIEAFEAAEDFQNEEYLALINEHHYPRHVLRMPLDTWPEPVNRSFGHGNYDIYVQMQGPSEFGIAGDASLLGWNRVPDLPKIKVPTLSLGGQYDTMDPEHMKMIAEKVQKGRAVICPNGSHLANYDDAENYFAGLVKFLNDVNEGKL